MSVPVGFGIALSNATALMIWPLWQYPHCTTSCSTQASCTARPTGSPDMASMVRIGRAATRETGPTQERVAMPSRCTVQAPQAAIPQPYLVPVIFSSSRRTQSSGVPGSTVTSLGWPLTVSRKVPMAISESASVGTGHSRFDPRAGGGDEVVVRERGQGPRVAVDAVAGLEGPTDERLLFVVLHE